MGSGGANSGVAGLRARRAGALFGALLGYGLFEAQWVRFRVLEAEVPGLPPALDGLRIAHLSDFHLGVPSPGVAAVARACAWVRERRPDLTVITGDLLTHPRGEPLLRELVGLVPEPAFAVLGNHDLAIARDPQARRSEVRELAPATLLRDSGKVVELRGVPVWIAGTDARVVVRGRLRTDPNTLSRDAGFRLLLCHYPNVVDRLEPGRFELVLAGHMHDGQIALPYPGGKVRFAHLSARYARGVYRRRAAVMHVSPGLGTTFVPFRFFARPEATELVLRSPRA